MNWKERSYDINLKINCLDLKTDQGKDVKYRVYPYQLQSGKTVFGLHVIWVDRCKPDFIGQFVSIEVAKKAAENHARVRKLMIPCMYPGHEGIESRARGLCPRCYSAAWRLVQLHDQTWEDLENAGICLPLVLEGVGVHGATRKGYRGERDAIDPEISEWMRRKLELAKSRRLEVELKASSSTA